MLSPGSPFTNFTQELFRGHEERILLKNAADDDHRMRPHDVNHGIASKFRQMVGADDRIVVAAPHLIHPRFELDEIVNVRSSSAAQSMWQTMRLSGNPALALPLANCSNASSIRS